MSAPDCDWPDIDIGITTINIKPQQRFIKCSKCGQKVKGEFSQISLGGNRLKFECGDCDMIEENEDKEKQ